jgi:hypothetical protein
VKSLRPRNHSCRTGQALVEFALIAPVLLLIIGASIDIGRGMLLYTLLQGASRDTARQAVLIYNSPSNTLPPSCTRLAPPCNLQPVVQSAHLLDVLGAKFIYADSPAIASAPAYGTYTTNGNQPLTISLRAPIASNTVYVFIYELNQSIPNPTPRWSCTTVACIATGRNVRLPGHQSVIVDLKYRWQPILTRLLGLPASVTFDSQAVERIEY